MLINNDESLKSLSVQGITVKGSKNEIRPPLAVLPIITSVIILYSVVILDNLVILSLLCSFK